MTTGSRGVHVVVPLRRRHGFDRVREVARAVADELVARRPDELTTEFRKQARRRLFVDVLRNGWAQTTVPPYAVRARPGAPVATPLRWEELEDDGLPRAGRAHHARRARRLERDGDPWARSRAGAGCGRTLP